MRFEDDPNGVVDEAGTPIKTWKSSKRGNSNGFSVSLQPEVRAQDVDAVAQLQECLKKFFPMEVKGGNVNVIHAGVYQNSDASSYKLTGFARTTKVSHWVAINAASVDRLRWVSLALTSNKSVRELLSLDQLPDEMIILISEFIVWIGVEFLVMHELGHVFSGHTALDASNKALNKLNSNKVSIAREIEADGFAALRLAETCASRQTF